MEFATESKLVRIFLQSVEMIKSFVGKYCNFIRESFTSILAIDKIVKVNKLLASILRY